MTPELRNALLLHPDVVLDLLGEIRLNHSRGSRMLRLFERLSEPEGQALIDAFAQKRFAAHGEQARVTKAAEQVGRQKIDEWQRTIRDVVKDLI